MEDATPLMGPATRLATRAMIDLSRVANKTDGERSLPFPVLNEASDVGSVPQGLLVAAHAGQQADVVEQRQQRGGEARDVGPGGGVQHLRNTLAFAYVDQAHVAQ